MIGRQREKRQLLEAFGSDESEFVAVFGRRRVGKTYLVRETLGSFFTFQHTGIKKGGKEVQWERFRESLRDQGHADCPELKSRYDAFDQLKVLLNAKDEARKVVFIDEIPWMGRSDASFISAVEHFWNAWAGFPSKQSFFGASRRVIMA